LLVSEVAEHGREGGPVAAGRDVVETLLETGATETAASPQLALVLDRLAHAAIDFVRHPIGHEMGSVEPSLVGDKPRMVLAVAIPAESASHQLALLVLRNVGIRSQARR
jgi:hypothetical protein